MKFVLVHGVSNTGRHFESCASVIRARGHEVWCPTLSGNRPGDDIQRTSLDDAISSLVDYFNENAITDAILLGHSWGGFPISGAADRLAPGRLRALIYLSAFVPTNGESLLDLMLPAPPTAPGTQDKSEITGALSFSEFRKTYVNDAPLTQARRYFTSLVPQPFRTISDPIKLSKNPRDLPIRRTYIRTLEDKAMPDVTADSFNLKKRLGEFETFTMSGGHCVHVTAPERLARKIIEAAKHEPACL